MSSPIEIIMNAGSGSDEDKDATKQKLAEAFKVNKLDAHFSFVKSGDEILELAKNAAKSDCKIIVAAGGDGTISAVAAEIVGTNKTLGVLPLGTLNHFAKDLQIPLDVEEAVRVIAENHSVAVDAGEVNGRIFINNSGIGLYPSIVRRRKRGQKLGYGKWSAAFWATLAILRRYPFFNIRLKVEDEKFIRRTPFVFVGNNEYEMESFNIGGRKCLDSGKLSLYLLHRTGRMGLIRLALRLVFGALRQAKDFDAFCAEELTIETRHKKRILVALDGEVVTLNTPLRYRILPLALRVIVPKGIETG